MTREIIISAKVDENINNYLDEESKRKKISKSQLIFEILNEKVLSVRSSLSDTEKFSIIKSEITKELEQKFNEMIEINSNAIIKTVNELLEEYPTTQELENIENLINNTFVTKGEINELIKKVDRLTSIMDNKQINYEKTKINIQNKPTIIEKEKEAPQRFSFKEDDFHENESRVEKENILDKLISINKEK